MKKTKNILLTICFLFALVTCNKKYDEPPVNNFPEGTIKTISDLKNEYTGTPFNIASNYIITGIITTEETNGNFYKEAFLQDNSGGIKLKLKNSGGLYIGDSIKINIQGLTLSDYGEMIQIEEVDVDQNVLKIATQKNINPYVVSINNLNMIEDPCKLIQINNVEFSDTNNTYSDGISLITGENELTDCNENVIAIRTSGYANFANNSIASGNGVVTGIFTKFGTEKQLLIRDINEVQLNSQRCNGTGGGGTGSGGTGGGVGSVVPVTSFNVDFQGFNDYDDIEIDGWINFKESGSRLWQAREFDNNLYAQITAYNSSDISNKSWLITPPIDFDINTNEVLQFKSAIAYYEHDSFSLYYSSNFDGSNVLNATWTEITGFDIAGPSANYVFVNSGPIDLSSYTGIGYIAFKYEGEAGSSETTTFILDDIELSN